MKKTIIIVTILILGLSLLTGCGQPTFQNSDIINCKEGKYALESSYKSNLEDMGYKADYIKVSKDGMVCTASLHLKKPTVIMGTEVQLIPLFNVNSGCVKYMTDKNKDPSLCIIKN